MLLLAVSLLLGGKTQAQEEEAEVPGKFYQATLSNCRKKNIYGKILHWEQNYTQYMKFHGDFLQLWRLF